MLKPIIIDDEVQILRGLEKLIDWNALGYEIPLGFCDPYAAIRSIQTTPCDLVITDIRMPELTGLELITKLRAINPEIRIVVISSYSDFQYMQKSLIAGVKNYLLKPIHEDELIETLIRISDELTHAKSETNALPLLQKQLFARLAAGQSYRLSASEKALYNSYAAKYRYQLLLTNYCSNHGPEHTSHLPLPPSVLTAEQHQIPIDSQTLAILLYPQNQNNVRILSERDILGNENSLTICTGLLNSFDLFFDSVCSLQRQFKATQFLHPDKQGVHLVKTEPYTDANTQTQMLNSQISFGISILREKLFSLSRTELEREFQDLGIRLREACPTVPSHTFIFAYNKLMHALITDMENQLGLAAESLKRKELKNDIPSLELLENTILDRLWTAIEAARELIIPNESGIVATAKLYIQLNYQKSLTLNSVASQFYFNPSYLSNLFSKTGQSFLSYVNNVRLDRGAVLLRKTEMTISSIASETGFQTEKNFYKAFRKKFDCTPTQYRIK